MIKQRKNIDDYNRPTQQDLDSLKHLDLVEIHWSGGNHGNYRVWIDKDNRKSALSNYDFNEDGSIKSGSEHSVECMINYNSINTWDIWELNLL